MRRVPAAASRLPEEVREIAGGNPDLARDVVRADFWIRDVLIHRVNRAGAEEILMRRERFVVPREAF